jgi:hypothetical protein
LPSVTGKSHPDPAMIKRFESIYQCPSLILLQNG